jgi:hypothetical protein
MRKFGLLATMVLLAVILLTSGVGTATAAPKTELQKNQILIKDATCTTDGQSYTFVINGMAKTGLLIDSTDKTFKITSYTVTFYDDQGNELRTDEFDSGTKINSRDDILKGCTGQVTANFEGIGDNVTAIYAFQGFLTPG